MDEVAVQSGVNEQGRSDGPKYFVNVEGVDHPWLSPTITTEQIATLGGWDPSQGVIEVDADNSERTLQPGEVVELKPGYGFAKKVRWKRGDSLIDQRLEQELALVQGRFRNAQRTGTWFLIPDYSLSDEGWGLAVTPVAFRAPPGYPGAQPYGIFVPAGLRYRGARPQSYQEPAGEKPPFPPDAWGLLSWGPDDAQWRAGATPATGSNLLNFALGFSVRFRQGA